MRPIEEEKRIVDDVMFDDSEEVNVTDAMEKKIKEVIAIIREHEKALGQPLEFYTLKAYFEQRVGFYQSIQSKWISTHSSDINRSAGNVIQILRMMSRVVGSITIKDMEPYQKRLKAALHKLADDLEKKHRLIQDFAKRL